MQVIATRRAKIKSFKLCGRETSLRGSEHNPVPHSRTNVRGKPPNESALRSASCSRWEIAVPDAPRRRDDAAPRFAANVECPVDSCVARPSVGVPRLTDRAVARKLGSHANPDPIRNSWAMVADRLRLGRARDRLPDFAKVGDQSKRRLAVQRIRSDAAAIRKSETVVRRTG